VPSIAPCTLTEAGSVSDRQRGEVTLTCRSEIVLDFSVATPRGFRSRM
jgi:hypothetical protein